MNRVRKDWLRANASSAWHDAAKGAYWQGHHALIERILASSKVETRICAWSEDDDVILAWAVVAPPHTIHFVCVGEQYRGHRYGLRLLAGLEDPIEYSHAPRSLNVGRLPKQWSFNMYSAINQE